MPPLLRTPSSLHAHLTDENILPHTTVMFSGISYIPIDGKMLSNHVINPLVSQSTSYMELCRDGASKTWVAWLLNSEWRQSHAYRSDMSTFSRAHTLWSVSELTKIESTRLRKSYFKVTWWGKDSSKTAFPAHCSSLLCGQSHRFIYTL